MMCDSLLWVVAQRKKLDFDYYWFFYEDFMEEKRLLMIVHLDGLSFLKEEMN